jgi:hypothetical protein
MKKKTKKKSRKKRVTCVCGELLRVTETGAEGDSCQLCQDRKDECYSLSEKFGHQFVNTPSHNLMHAILRRTILDAFSPEQGCTNCDTRVARRMLMQQMWFLEEVGINSEWIHRVIKSSFLFNTDNRR